ncbi:MAG TPA: OmpW family outer membrane protein, partial [Fimbriimonadaceae bacterium]|nr:OmpW family outer membrane protein [Fimbriimonadaceae bacterium]
APGPWMGRIRGSYFVPANHSYPFSYLGGGFGPNDLHVEQKLGLEGDLSYLFKRGFAVELSVGAPLQTKVNLLFGAPLGTITQMPTSLTAQYHYQVPRMPVNAYVGVGVAESFVTKTSLSALGNSISVTHRMTGTCYQIGADIAIAQGFYLNLDFRHMQLATNLKDVNTNSFIVDANMAPNFYSIGLGYRF